jgi:CubicO group peptidase (beta-lactamase class C family)
LGSATVRNLLRHNSGIAPYADLAGKLSDAGEVRKRILTMAPECSPGKMTAYSCLGFITLMAIVERTSRMGLAEFLHEQFFAPAGIEAFYRPMPHWFVRCAPTERTPIWRREVARKRGEGWSNGEFVQGSVHDPLAYLLGGVSGNAGLFATIRAVAQFGSLLAQNHDLFGGGLMEWVTVASSESSRALGFDTKSPEGSSAGTKFGPRSFGHTGYTGTCLWVDPDADIFGVLLTNRVHPDDHGAEIAQARPEFFDLAYAAAIEL